MNSIRGNLFNSQLRICYRKDPKSFTRDRKLPFTAVALLILQKSTRSLQNRLNEFFDYIALESASASAFTQARANLSHELFRDLNRESYAGAYYAEEDYELYKGHRLLSIDGSNLRLPNTVDIRQEFGEIRIKNQQGTGRYTGALSSALYDVLNEIAVDAIIAPGEASEVELAHKHLEVCREKDLVLFDRNYAGYELFAAFRGKNVNFVCRCSSNAFKIVKDFIAQKELTDIIVKLKPNKDHSPKVRQGLLPAEITIRLVKVTLSTGEIEILATSLLDPKNYPLEIFLELYGMRWGIETFFDRLKNRLSLEHFTGKTSESVKQDFYATIVVSNIESEISSPVDEAIQAETVNALKRKVNKSISFNAVKEHVFELLICHDCELPELQDKLCAIFRRGTIPIRPGRSQPRNNTVRRSLNFHQRLKKVVF